MWHPAGAHPFVGQNEALVHNGDFANYYSICEYLAQRNIYPLFLTDTEVSALLFDLLYRSYKYPLEYVIEAFAPTTERDFSLLPADKQRIYKLIQKTHMHGSPDGPWFFLIAQSVKEDLKPVYRLIGITDTSMLRPQVFALQNGTVPIGLSASEKQAIDATLESLSTEDPRFWSCADYYWSARGGSYTDGGAFSFSVHPESNGKATLISSDKFGMPVYTDKLKQAYIQGHSVDPQHMQDVSFEWAKKQFATWNYDQVESFLTSADLNVLTKLFDQFYPIGQMRRSSLRSLLEKRITKLLEELAGDSQTLVINARGFAPQGEHSLAREIVKGYTKGFKKMIVFYCRGQRFIGNGLGPKSNDVVIHVYGSSGDYLASGIDGAEIHVHGTAQDQLAQIMNNGTLVVHGDVGQTFMYGAKGGKAFVRGNTAGRPLINAVGNPRVVINGTCLDYLAESFMAGHPLRDGGFVILNALGYDEEGSLIELESPYPGGNLFSLATGGAVYIRDPMRIITNEQLNGGEICELTQADWDLILPYLEENAKHFEIPISRLLEYQGRVLSYQQAYRKIHPLLVRAMQEEEAWVKSKD